MATIYAGLIRAAFKAVRRGGGGKPLGVVRKAVLRKEVKKTEVQKVRLIKRMRDFQPMEQWPHICGALSGSNAFPLLAGFFLFIFETRHTQSHSHTSHTATMIRASPHASPLRECTSTKSSRPLRSELTIVFKHFLCLPKEFLRAHEHWLDQYLLIAVPKVGSTR